MPLILYTNLASLQTRNALARSQDGAAVTLQRLSSGLRIHSARDDAAGLAVSTRIEAQWRGTEQAARNANDGISLMQVGDHALGSMSDALQHLRDLAVQSMNGTLSASDRTALDTDLQQGLAEIDRTAAATTFNGHALLDGSYGQATFQIGSGGADTLQLDLSTSVRTSQLGAIATATSSDLRTGGGGFQFAGTYTTTALPGLDFSRPTVSFSPGITTTAAAPPTNYSGLGQATTFRVDGLNVTLNTNYGSGGAVANAVQQQLDQQAAGAYAVSQDSAGRLRIAKNYAANANTTPPAVAGVSGANAAAFDNGSTTAGTSPSATTKAGFSVDGHAVSLTQNYADANALVADLQHQLDSGAGAGTYHVSGSLAGISIARTGDTRLPVVDSFTNAGQADFGRRQASGLTLAAGDFTVKLGTHAAVDITGTFATADDLAKAVTAKVGDAVANIDQVSGTLQINARDTITIGGAQTGAGGALAFGQLVNPPTGSLQGIDITSVADARDAVLRIDASIDQVSARRGTFGATTSRLEAISSQATQDADILQVARGRIVNADMATESANYARSQVLQQAGVAMVAQANVRSNDVLTLLR